MALSIAMNQNQIIAALVRGAAWQLIRRSPTWLLLPISVGPHVWLHDRW
jgi:hypothetical protein